MTLILPPCILKIGIYILPQFLGFFNTLYEKERKKERNIYIFCSIFPEILFFFFINLKIIYLLIAVGVWVPFLLHEVSSSHVSKAHPWVRKIHNNLQYLGS
ncbi:hypothetical protein S245_024248 [Arachis hypogaea]